MKNGHRKRYPHKKKGHRKKRKSPKKSVQIPRLSIKAGQFVRSQTYNRHHIVNRCNGGTNSSDNLIRLDEARHNVWHFLFRNHSFMETAEILLRAQYSTYDYIRFDAVRRNAWYFLFGNKSFAEVAELLLRTQRAINHKGYRLLNVA